MSQFVIPNVDSVKSMLELLLGEGLKVTLNGSEAPASPHLATYIGDDDGLVALCACSDEFVGYAGAALTMVPAGVAKEMVAKNDFSEMVLGNFYEVMNICSRLLMSEHSPHLRLKDTLKPERSAAAMSELKGEVKSVGFDIDIPRYGTGALTFHVAAV